MNSSCFNNEILNRTKSFVSDLEYYSVFQDDDSNDEVFESVVDFVSCLLSALLLVSDPEYRGEIVGLLESINGLESPFADR